MSNIISSILPIILPILGVVVAFIILMVFAKSCYKVAKAEETPRDHWW